MVLGKFLLYSLLSGKFEKRLRLWFLPLPGTQYAAFLRNRPIEGTHRLCPRPDECVEEYVWNNRTRRKRLANTAHNSTNMMGQKSGDLQLAYTWGQATPQALDLGISAEYTEVVDNALRRLTSVYTLEPPHMIRPTLWHDRQQASYSLDWWTLQRADSPMEGRKVGTKSRTQPNCPSM